MELNKTFDEIKNIYRKSVSSIKVLIKDVSEILSSKTLEKKHLIRIVRNLLEMTIDESLKIFEIKLKKILQGNILKGLIQLEQEIFNQDSDKDSLQQNSKREIKMPFTPETIVKRSRPFTKKIIKPYNDLSKKTLEEFVNKKNMEVKGLRDILKKSKKGFKDFLRSFGWSDHEIQDAMRTASIKESPSRNRNQINSKNLKEIVTNEYQLVQESEVKLKNTQTKNIVIKEYLPVEVTKKKDEKSDNDFFSKQTNNIKQESLKEKSEKK